VNPAGIAIHPFDPDREWGYVYSTARHATAEAMGGRHVSRPVLNPMVDATLDGCASIRVATFADDRDDILAFVAQAPDSTFEFVYLRQSLFDEGRCRTLKKGMRSQDPDEVAATRMAMANEFRVAIAISRALLGSALDVTLRRVAPWAVMNALPLAGYGVTVVPRAI